SALVMRLRCPSLVVYHSFRDRRALHSFPTRRSSDLLALTNKRVVYDLLFQAAAATLLQVAANPKRLGAAIGGLMVLHTWGQRLQHHPHVHCVVPMGGLAPDGTRWIHPRPRFFLPIPALRKLFRGKLVAGVRDAFRDGRLDFHSTLDRMKDDNVFRAVLRL